MGIPKHMAVAMSGLVFAGAAALTAGAVTPASADALTGTPQLVAGGAGGGGPAPRPRRVVVHRMAAPVRHCCNVSRSAEFQRAHVFNRNFNFSRSDSEQAQHQREHQFDNDRDFKFTNRMIDHD
jgi:hypothetical protein